MYWIDTHTHLDMLEQGAEAAIAHAESLNVRQFINIGTNADDHPRVLAVAQKFYPKVYCALGVHPHDAKDYALAQEFLKNNLDHKEVVAVGEIGLDYYYNHSSQTEQLAAFEQQLELAAEKNLPVEIHTRDAEAETIAMLKRYKDSVKGLLHCFTGTQWLADQALDIGFNISISGVVTFNKAEELRSVVKSVPLDRLHVETDAPFLAPVPLRGKKNEPAFMVHTAQKVADLKEVSLEELAKQVQINTQKLFPKIKVLEESHV
ncbi:MAG: TatD family hydrolase [Bdellovibrionaceae bacterium]|nr:TatD family hydrolase [Pseudobdellovibrionaceae bacterium]